MAEVDLSIIIPAYMEAALIEHSLATLADYLGQRHFGNVEVLVVTADSSDGTADLAESQAKLFHSLRVVHAGPRVGKGRDVRLGMFEAKGRYRVFMDADLATPLIHLDQVHDFASRNGEVLIAMRELGVIHKGLLRKTISLGGNLLAQLVLLPGIPDTQCGFKAFRADVAENVFGRMTILGWGFDLEILAIARKLRYKIEKIAAPDWTDPKAAEATIGSDSAARATLQVLRDLFKVRLNTWTGVYDQPSYKPSSSK